MTETVSGRGTTRPRLLQATMAWSLFILDLALVAILWPIGLWLARADVAGLLSNAAVARGLIFPLTDLLLLYAMGLYRREAFVEKHHSALRVPMVVAMGATIGLIACRVTF